MSRIDLLNQTPADAGTPATGKTSIGVDASGALYTKNAAGVVTPIAGSGSVSAVAAALAAHEADVANPHETTKGQVGLGNVDNTSDLSKPVSTAQAAADAVVLASAATDATSKANAAQANAISTAATDATTKANAVQANLTAHIGNATAAHAASAIANTPAGGIAATTVQAAINELDTEKAPADLSGAAQQAALASKLAFLDVVLLGDSITDVCGGPRLNGTTQDFSPQGYFSWGNVFLGSRLNLVVNAGVSGGNATQLAARFQGDVAAYSPAIVSFMIGINDVFSVTNANLEARTLTYYSDMSATLDSIARIGALTVLGTIPPVSSTYTVPLTTDQKTAWSRWNNWLRQEARRRKGVVLADYAAALTDPSVPTQPIDDGGVPSSITNDGLHPAASGGVRMGRVFADSLRELIPKNNTLSTAGNAMLLTNPALTGATGSTPPTGWARGDLSGTSNEVYTYEARTDGIAGNWLVITTGATTHIRLDQLFTGTFTDTTARYVFEVEYEIVTPATAFTSAYLACALETAQPNASGIGFAGCLMDVSFSSGGIVREPRISEPLRSGILRTPPLPGVALALRLRPTIRFKGGNAVYKIGRVSCVKVN